MMKRRNIGYSLTELLAVLFAIALVASYITNFVKFTNCDFEAPYKCEVIHGVGIIPPFSILTVWFDSDE